MKQFWKDKNVLITGHTGFSGSWLVSWLDILGANIYGIALEPTEKSLYRQNSIQKCLRTSYIQDIREGEALTATIQAINPEVVFHLAAQPIVGDSYKNPSYTYEV